MYCDYGLFSFFFLSLGFCTILNTLGVQGSNRPKIVCVHQLFKGNIGKEVWNGIGEYGMFAFLSFSIKDLFNLYFSPEYFLHVTHDQSGW